MRPVAVLIFHAQAPGDSGPLLRALAEARHALAIKQRDAFLAAGADEAVIVAGPPDGLAFGERLRAAALSRAGGLVVLGSGSVPLARAADLRRFVETAAGPPGRALANNRYSADVVAISRAADLADLPPLPADNALPRWLEERAGVAVTDLRTRWRLGVDIDTPLDLVVIAMAAGGAAARDLHAAAPLVGERLAALAGILANRRAELLVAGRVSATTLKWLESGVACRVRAIVEERGLRAASRLALSDEAAGSAGAGSAGAGSAGAGSAGAGSAGAGSAGAGSAGAGSAGAGSAGAGSAGAGSAGAGSAGAGSAGAGSARPPRSVLGELLDRDGPESLALAVSRLADAAVIDTRVLLAHRLGAIETSWPPAEDRFASDLLLPDRVVDPWLNAITESAATSTAPILLGGHTLVNGGLRLLAQRARAGVR